jgi:hypothetical protein
MTKSYIIRGRYYIKGYKMGNFGHVAIIPLPIHMLEFVYILMCELCVC